VVDCSSESCSQIASLFPITLPVVVRSLTEVSHVPAATASTVATFCSEASSIFAFSLTSRLKGVLENGYCIQAMAVALLARVIFEVSGLDIVLHASDFVVAGLVSALTFIASDAVSQLFVLDGVRLDYFQLIRVGIFGFALKGPLQSAYYCFVEAMWPGRGCLLQVFGKILLDLLFFSPLVNVLFLFCLPLLEGRPLKAATKNVETQILAIQRAAMKFWLLAHILNYTVVPPSRRVGSALFFAPVYTA